MIADVDRRKLLHLTMGAGAGLVGAGLLAAGQAPAASSLAISNRALSNRAGSSLAGSSLAGQEADLAAYAAVVAALKRLPDNDPRGWAGQARIHLQHGRHASWLFFPWHRAYLRFFEQIGRVVTGRPSFTVPRWDWTLHPQIPAPFLDPTTPLYAEGRAAVPGTSAAAEFVGPATIEALLNEPNFLVFGGAAVGRDEAAQDGPGYGLVEQGPHNYVHGFVGGLMGAFTSPLDPLFWPHHAHIDQLWTQWSVRHPHPADAAWRDTVFTEFVDGEGRPTRVSVAQTLALT
jgi:hypothetical protein